MRRVTKDTGRGMVSGIVSLNPSREEDGEDGKDCPPECQCYAHVTKFTQPGAIEMAQYCGWDGAEIRFIHNLLPQHTYQFDMVVWP